MKTRLEYIIEKYSKDLYSFCYYLTTNKYEADDLYQDAFERMINKGELPETDEEAKQMLLSMSVSLWKDKRRKFAWRKRIFEEKYIPEATMESESIDEKSPESTLIQDESRRYVMECVNSLPDKMRIVILLYYMENLKVSEIAELLHVPPGTVKSRLHIAKEKLAVLMRADRREAFDYE